MDPNRIIGSSVIVGRPAKNSPPDLLLMNLIDLMIQHAVADVDEHFSKPG